MSARMLAIMPARESSVNPINISSLSKRLSYSLAPLAEEMLLRVKAANWLSFYWFLMCCRIPIKMVSIWLFFANIPLASALISAMNVIIYKVCSFISMLISDDMRIFKNTLILFLTWIIIF